MAGPLLLAAGSMLDCSAHELLHHAAGAGFDGVGLRLSGEHEVEETAALRSRATELGLLIHDTEVHRIQEVDSDPALLLDCSAALGADHVLAVSDIDDRDETVRRLEHLSRQCRDRSLQLALEYMAWTTPSDPIDAIRIASATGCVLVADLLHHVRIGAGLDELDAIVESGTLGWVQVCDAPAAAPVNLLEEARHHRLPPGEGELPLHSLLSRLPAETALSVEVQSDELAYIEPGIRARLLHTAARSLR